MIGKTIKYGLVSTAAVAVAGGLLFGGDVISYARSSALSIQREVKGSVPVEFELRRARDLVGEIIPELHANIRLIAQDEVEIDHLRKDIADSRQALAQEEARIARIRDLVDTREVVYRPGGGRVSHEQLMDELARRFDYLKEAKMVLAGKEKLMETRQQSLAAAIQMLEKTRSRKALLEQKIESLEAQHRLVKAASVGSQVQFDNSKLAQTEKLLTEIKKRLDVAEAVQAREAQFAPATIDVDAVIDEAELLGEVDEYLGRSSAGQAHGEQAGEPLSRASSN